MNETLMTLAAIAAMVWPATELLGRALKNGPRWLANKSLLAVYLGMLMGCVAHGSGQVDLGAGAWGWVNAMMLGLFSTATATGAHDTGKAAVKKVSGGAA